MSQPIPPVAVLVAHRVRDWDAFKKAFDDHEVARKEASILGHDVNRGADDPNMIYVYCPASDAGKLKAFLDSSHLRDAMNSATVEGEPSIYMMKPMSADFIADQKLPGMVVIHKVDDYDKWRVGYDDFDARRKEAGIVGHAVNQALDDRHRVIVYHQANDLDTLRTFAASDELRDRMKNAGVVGTPDIHFIESVDIAEY